MLLPINSCQRATGRDMRCSNRPGDNRPAKSCGDREGTRTRRSRAGDRQVDGARGRRRWAMMLSKITAPKSLLLGDRSVDTST